MLCARPDTGAERQDADVPTRVTTTGSAAKPFRVALRTLPVIICHRDREMHVTAFLDGGSDTSYLKEDLADALGFTSETEPLQIATLGGQIQSLTTKHANIMIKDAEEGPLHKLHVCTLPEVCNQLEVIQWTREKGQWGHLRDLPFQETGTEIDLLIGSDHPELHAVLERRSADAGSPVAERTPLGWTCVGPMREPGQITSQVRTGAHAVTVPDESEPDNILQQFGKSDSLGPMPDSKTSLAAEIKRAVTPTEETLDVQAERQEIGVPWRGQTSAPSQNSNGKNVVQTRLQCLEASLPKTPNPKDKNEDLIASNIEKGFVRILEKSDIGLKMKPGGTCCSSYR